jgi:hypothetical protein
MPMAVPRAPILRKQVALDDSGPTTSESARYIVPALEKVARVHNGDSERACLNMATPGRLRLIFTSRPMTLYQIHRKGGKTPQETL